MILYLQLIAIHKVIICLLKVDYFFICNPLYLCNKMDSGFSRLHFPILHPQSHAQKAKSGFIFYRRLYSIHFLLKFEVCVDSSRQKISVNYILNFLRVNNPFWSVIGYNQIFAFSYSCLFKLPFFINPVFVVFFTSRKSAMLPVCHFSPNRNRNNEVRIVVYISSLYSYGMLLKMLWVCKV